MREKIARAVMMARDNGGCIVEDWDREDRENPHVAQALRQAAAALDALMEPTDEMLAAARAAVAVDGPLGSRHSFRAMIKAAKEDK